MPKEKRFIIFNLEEIQDALRIHSVMSKSEEPPTDTLSSIKPDDNDPDTVHATFKAEDGTETKTEYGRVFFGQALVFYCQGNGIPIPRAGTKTLKIQPDEIILFIEL